jgi:hypothetical protein
LKLLNTINNLLWLGVPDVIKGIAIALVFVLIFKNVMKKYSIIFYVYPGLLFLWYCLYGILALCNVDVYGAMGKTIWWEILWLPHSYALDTVVGNGFILIVMFIGVLPKWDIVKKLYTIRKEMSIIGGFILVGHGVMRLSTMKWAWENTQELNLFLIFTYGILGVILLVLIFIPWITSFAYPRKLMSAKKWKKLQTYTSVPLVILICAFGIFVNMGWGLEVLPSLDKSLWEVKTIADGTAVSDLSQGYQVATGFLSARIYLCILILYVWLRKKKNKKML